MAWQQRQRCDAASILRILRILRILTAATLHKFTWIWAAATTLPNDSRRHGQCTVPEDGLPLAIGFQSGLLAVKKMGPRS